MARLTPVRIAKGSGCFELPCESSLQQKPNRVNVMPVPAMAESVIDHQKRFQAAVDVIQNLPKNGSYRPSYEMMLRFYGLYKQAMCGPCAVSRPSFWDPVGRYKWDAWSRLGEMSKESAMAAYVQEMKKVAQEVIDTMPMNENTAAFFHHFEPLYQVIDDMPRPPESLLKLREGLKGSEAPYRSGEEQNIEVEQSVPADEASPSQDNNPSLSEAADMTANTVPNDSGVSESLVLTSDSESEIFCDSLDSVEQLVSNKHQAITSNGFHNNHIMESSQCQITALDSHSMFRKVGAGQGGEGAEDRKGPGRRGRDAGRDASHHNWRERGVPLGSPRREALGGGGGAGRGGGDGSEGGVERLHDVQLQQQIVFALRRLREDMRSVMERLEVVERLAGTHSQASDWQPCLQCAAASSQQEERWWPFDVSGQTVLLFLLWPFVAQGLVHLLRKAHKRNHIVS